MRRTLAISAAATLIAGCVETVNPNSGDWASKTQAERASIEQEIAEERASDAAHKRRVELLRAGAPRFVRYG